MSAMSVPFGVGFVPARKQDLVEPQRSAAAAVLPAIEESVKVKKRIEDLTINELLFQALYGDLSQFCSEDR
jgi:hypothetical protein